MLFVKVADQIRTATTVAQRYGGRSPTGIGQGGESEMELKDDGTIVRTAQEIAEYEAGIDRIFAETTADAVFPPSLILILFAIPVAAWAIAMVIVQFMQFME